MSVYYTLEVAFSKEFSEWAQNVFHWIGMSICSLSPRFPPAIARRTAAEKANLNFGAARLELARQLNRLFVL